MRIVIRNLSQQALKAMGEELGDPKRWLEEAKQSYELDKCFDVTLSDEVMIKTHFDSITIDCGSQLYFLLPDDFEKVVIV